MTKSACGIVTLLTDFGVRDPFVGVMKGVMLARCPGVSLVDLTHEIEPQRIEAAAFWLGQAYGWFPAGTVHVVVVDPGVGSARHAVVVRAARQLFVGPDNGCFEAVSRREPTLEVRRIDLDRCGLSPPSQTFHGRDVFAPVAAALASGALAFENVGPLSNLLETNALPAPSIGTNGAEGEVVVIDRFGNLVTNLEGLARTAPGPRRVRILGHELPVVRTYADVAEGALAGLVGSFGQLEIAERNGSAAKTLGAQRGTRVRVDW